MKINIMYYNNCFFRKEKLSGPNFLISNKWQYDTGINFFNLNRMKKYEDAFKN